MPTDDIQLFVVFSAQLRLARVQIRSSDAAAQRSEVVQKLEAAQERLSKRYLELYKEERQQREDEEKASEAAKVETSTNDGGWPAWPVPEQGLTSLPDIKLPVKEEKGKKAAVEASRVKDLLDEISAELDRARALPIEASPPSPATSDHAFDEMAIADVSMDLSENFSQDGEGSAEEDVAMVAMDESRLATVKMDESRVATVEMDESREDVPVMQSETTLSDSRSEEIASKSSRIIDKDDEGPVELDQFGRAKSLRQYSRRSSSPPRRSRTPDHRHGNDHRDSYERRRWSRDADRSSDRGYGRDRRSSKEQRDWVRGPPRSADYHRGDRRERYSSQSSEQAFSDDTGYQRASRDDAPRSKDTADHHDDRSRSHQVMDYGHGKQQSAERSVHDIADDDRGAAETERTSGASWSTGFAAESSDWTRKSEERISENAGRLPEESKPMDAWEGQASYSAWSGQQEESQWHGQVGVSRRDSLPLQTVESERPQMSDGYDSHGSTRMLATEHLGVREVPVDEVHGPRRAPTASTPSHVSMETRPRGPHSIAAETNRSSRDASWSQLKSPESSSLHLRVGPASAHWQTRTSPNAAASWPLPSNNDVGSWQCSSNQSSSAIPEHIGHLGNSPEVSRNLSSYRTPSEHHTLPLDLAEYKGGLHPVATDHPLPVATDHHLPVATDHLPVAMDHLPGATDHLPGATDHQPVEHSSDHLHPAHSSDHLHLAHAENRLAFSLSEDHQAFARPDEHQGCTYPRDGRSFDRPDDRPVFTHPDDRQALMHSDDRPAYIHSDERDRFMPPDNQAYAHPDHQQFTHSEHQHAFAREEIATPRGPAYSESPSSRLLVDGVGAHRVPDALSPRHAAQNEWYVSGEENRQREMSVDVRSPLRHSAQSDWYRQEQVDTSREGRSNARSPTHDPPLQSEWYSRKRFAEQRSHPDSRRSLDRDSDYHGRHDDDYHREAKRDRGDSGSRTRSEFRDRHRTESFDHHQHRRRQRSESSGASSPPWSRPKDHHHRGRKSRW